MCYSSIKPGQVLWTKTGESVEVFAVSKSSLTLSYKGEIHVRPKSVLDDKLFVKRPQEKTTPTASTVVRNQTITNPKQNNSAKKRATEPKVEKQHTLKTNPVNPTAAHNNYSDNIRACNNCMNYRSEKCYGSKTICSDFKYTGAISNTEREVWPEYGDASYMRMKRRSRNK
jgi:hypothetical protein